MTDTSIAPLKTTPLHARHLAHGARMVPFGGWDMPVEYSGITDEHMAVRRRVGLFDVSHMGQLELAGADALAAVQHISSNDASRLKIGQIHYSGLMSERGTFVDDLLVYRMAEDHFLLVVNAGNISQDFEYIKAQIAGFADVDAVDSSARYALVALQGPAAERVLQPLTAVDLSTLKYYWFTHGEVAGIRATISRTGYTGEDGFEVFVPPAEADRLWQALLEAGAGEGIVPAGLGARDTLRLEAGMRLHGNDIDDTTTPIEADLSWIVGWQKEAFLGRDILHRQRDEGTARRLVGFELVDRGIARHGYPVLVDRAVAGIVTSGTQTPYVKKAIGMAYVPSGAATPGGAIEIDVRGRHLHATIVPLPFYKRSRS